MEISIGITNAYDESSTIAFIVGGVFNSFNQDLNICGSS